MNTKQFAAYMRLSTIGWRMVAGTIHSVDELKWMLEDAHLEHPPIEMIISADLITDNKVPHLLVWAQHDGGRKLLWRVDCDGVNLSISQVMEQ